MDSKQQKLVEDNMDLVYFIIHKRYPTFATNEDIKQAGMMGLCEAANRYDESKGLFSTYARKYIIGEVHKEVVRKCNESHTIPLDTPIGEDGLLSDIIMGDDDIAYMDDNFYEELTDFELRVLKFNAMGYKSDEIASRLNSSTQKVWKTLRVIDKKWRKWNEN